MLLHGHRSEHEKNTASSQKEFLDQCVLNSATRATNKSSKVGAHVLGKLWAEKLAKKRFVAQPTSRGGARRCLRYRRRKNQRENHTFSVQIMHVLLSCCLRSSFRISWTCASSRADDMVTQRTKLAVRGDHESN